MRPFVDNSGYRQQSVDLQPHGNTISVECPSDNPFEDAQDISIVTQGSGDQALAGPDPRMKSKRVITKGKRLAPIHAGKAPVRQVMAHAAAPLKHNGFIPGLGALVPRAARVQVHPAILHRKRTAPKPAPHPRAGGTHPRTFATRFIPGMGGLGAPLNLATGLNLTPGAQPNSWSAAPDTTTTDFSSTSSSWLPAATSTAADVSSAIVAAQNAKTAQAQAAAAQAQAGVERAGAAGGMMGGKVLPWVIGGGLALLVGFLVLSKPKKA
jgi:hypothetical protein